LPDFFKYKELNKIRAIAEANNAEAYLVGGFVRDMILVKPCMDIDITVVGDGAAFAELIAHEFGTKLSAVYKRFGTALLELDDLKIEFASARKESYSKDSRKPVVTFTGLDDDLSRRDFTINTLAVPLTSISNEIIDRFGGLQDIENKIIRTPLEPLKTFDDDPLRIMRAARFASQLQFTVHPRTLDAMKEMRYRLRITESKQVVSQERITDEFLKILASPKPSTGLNILQETGVMEVIFPEVANLEGVEQRKDFHHKDVFHHTLQVLDNVAMKSDNLWLRFAALMHDIAKPPTKKFVEGIGWTFHGHEELGARWQRKIFRKLRLPLDKEPYLKKLIRLHLRPIALAEKGVTDSAIRRLIFEAGDDIEDLMLLCRADITSKDLNKIKKFLSNFDRVEKRINEVEERDRIRNFQPPVRGDEIMRICNLQPGKKVGIIKQKITDAILDGIIPNEYEAALNYLHKIKNEILNS
jgi:tRNA nucleotidyltransferase/poly(A) polymerase